MYGSDAKNSMEPDEFAKMVNEIRDIEKGLGSSVDKDLMAESLKNMKKIFEKSIVANQDLAKGTVLTWDTLSYKKPGDGINARFINDIIGKELCIDVEKDHKFDWNDFR